MKLNEVFTSWLSGDGFFGILADYMNGLQDFTMPDWLPTYAVGGLLDYEYHGNRSGLKTISPLVESIYDKNSEEIPNARLIKLCSMFLLMYGTSIDRQWANYVAEYNPIENYSLTESGSDIKTGNDTNVKSGNRTNKKDGSRTISKAESATENGTLTNSASSTTENQIYGFNSSTGVNSDKSTNTQGTTTTFNNTDVETFTNYGDTETFNNVQDKMTYNNTVTHSLSRSGNIGVTTSQQMLQSDIDLWQWNFYRDYLFPLADKVLTLPIYE